MAVINSPWVGDARGKLGSGVYLRSKGQTIARGYNPSPLNRRTSPQQVQRSTFGSAVKFYSRGVQNLFKFAYQDKPTKESDYNAFMRLNAKIGPYWGPSQMNDDITPAIAPWAVSRGSLTSLKVNITQNEVPRIVWTDAPALGTDPSVAQVSQYIIDNSVGVQQGDILTFVHIVIYGEPGTESDPYVPFSDDVPVWNIGQMVIDTTDETPFSLIGGWSQSGGGEVDLWVGRRNLGGGMSMAACIHSRITNGKLYVSSEDMTLSASAQECFELYHSQAWMLKVLEAWHYEETSILQGSISDTQMDLPEYSVKVYADLPISLHELSQTWIVIGGNIPTSKLAGGNNTRGLLLDTTNSGTYYIDTVDGEHFVTDGADRFGPMIVKRGNGNTLVRFNVQESVGSNVTAVRYVNW